MTGLWGALRMLGAARLIAMAAVALGMLGLLAILTLRGGTDRMALLYSDLDTKEAGQISEQLDRAHIAHEIGAGGGEILVPTTQVSPARLLLARNGLPSGGSIGNEIFDRGDGLVASQFQQSINQARALEGELARTIRAISGVRAARVHLVLPRREPFSRSAQDAQASVLLTMAGAGRLDREGVQSIVNLVAAAVPGLRAQNIAVVDSRGNLLVRAGEPTGPEAVASTAEEARHAIETRLSHAVEQMLERTLGAGRARAEAAVDLDFDQVHETQERFDPDGQVVRSVQNVTDSNRSTEVAAAATTQNNLPNADAGASPAGSQAQRQEETTNYEIGKTIRTIVHEHPQIRRISLAVLVDGSEVKNEKGVVQWQPRTAEELAHINALVRGAIGYDEKRGDHVEIVNMRFASEELPEPPPGLFDMGLEKPDMVRLAQTGMMGLVGLLALALVFRPMMTRLLRLSDAGAQSGLALATLGSAPGRSIGHADNLVLESLPGAAAALPRISGPVSAQDALTTVDDVNMLNIANIEGQMRASLVRRVSELIEKHPVESLSIVRSWMQQGAS